jgi:hypothetical protein
MKMSATALRHPWRTSSILLLFSAALAIALARPYAGSWNDSSRLATAECLSDYHTLAIDDSVFTQGFHPASSEAINPFSPDDGTLQAHGTFDKLYIRGHYYSDKPPVPAVLIAAAYQIWKWCGGETAQERPDRFCYLMTLTFSGLAYVIAVWCMYRVGLGIGLPQKWCLVLTGSFALATVAPTYAEHVNGHIVLLAVAAGLLMLLVRQSTRAETGRQALATFAGLGALAGLGYTADAGAGPMLVLVLLPVVLTRTRRPGYLAVFALAMLPWLALHHALNYAIGGTFRPANAVPEYFSWPQSPFDTQNMTGVWNHSPGHFLVYAVALLFGKRGFVNHNLPLFLLLAGLTTLWRHRSALRLLALMAVGWCGGIWLLYAALSTNYSGPCCSIRWFVPLLAPAYFLIALLLKERPGLRKDFLVLSAWGGLLGGLMMWKGPWMGHMVPGFWPIQAAALLSWAVCLRQGTAKEYLPEFAADTRTAAVRAA